MNAMWLFRNLPHYFALSILLVLASLSVASAKELVGTPVPVNDNTAAAVEASPVLPEPSRPATDPQRQHWNSGFGEPFSHFENGNFAGWALLIPLFFIVFVMGGPFLLVGFLIFLHYRAKAQRRANLNQNIDKLLAAGQDIPIELLRGDEPKTAQDDSNINRGIKNICIGTGLLLFLTIMFGIEIGSIGFIVIGLGVSRVIIWKLSQPTTTPRIETQD